MAKKLEEPERLEILRLHQAGRVPVAELARKFHRAVRTIRGVLAEAGVAEHGPTQPIARDDLREAFDKLGEPPADPLEAELWAHSACAVMARQIMTDTKYEGKESHRRKELRDTFAMMTKLVPRARLRKAEKIVRDDIDALTQEGGAEYDDAENVSGPRYRSTPLRSE